MFQCLDATFVLAWARVKICNRSAPEESPPARRFSLEKKLASGRGWPHHIYKSTITCETKTRQDSCDTQFPWKQIRNRGVVGRITDERKTHVTREKTRNLGAG